MGKDRQAGEDAFSPKIDAKTGAKTHFKLTTPARLSLSNTDQSNHSAKILYREIGRESNFAPRLPLSVVWFTTYHYIDRGKENTVLHVYAVFARFAATCRSNHVIKRLFCCMQYPSPKHTSHSSRVLGFHRLQSPLERLQQAQNQAHGQQPPSQISPILRRSAAFKSRHCEFPMGFAL